VSTTTPTPTTVLDPNVHSHHLIFPLHHLQYLDVKQLVDPVARHVLPIQARWGVQFREQSGSQNDYRQPGVVGILLPWVVHQIYHKLNRLPERSQHGQLHRLGADKSAQGRGYSPFLSRRLHDPGLVHSSRDSAPVCGPPATLVGACATAFGHWVRERDGNGEHGCAGRRDLVRVSSRPKGQRRTQVHGRVQRVRDHGERHFRPVVPDRISNRRMETAQVGVIVVFFCLCLELNESLQDMGIGKATEEKGAGQVRFLFRSLCCRV
jgi:hypothetical protein